MTFCPSLATYLGATPCPLPCFEAQKTASFRTSFFPPASIGILSLSGDAAGDAFLVPQLPLLRPRQVSDELSPQVHLSCRRAAQTWGSWEWGRRAAARSWATESEPPESSLKTAARLRLLPTCMGRRPALHGPEAPSLSFHVCPSCPWCSSSPSTPALKGVSALSQQFHL